MLPTKRVWVNWAMDTMELVGNYAIGGKVAAPCHIDVIYDCANLEIDGVLVMENGVVRI